jgi:hypothetical protein
VASIVQYRSVGQCESNRGGLETGSYLKHRFYTPQRGTVDTSLCVGLLELYMKTLDWCGVLVFFGNMFDYVQIMAATRNGIVCSCSSTCPVSKRMMILEQDSR